jgi:type II secretory pathway component GspD/PulD (secretin)
MLLLPFSPRQVLGEELVFTDTEIFKVMEILSSLGNFNIFVDESVKNKKITFFAKDLSVKKSLDMIVATNGLEMKKTAASTYLIYPKNKTDDYEDDKVSHVFHLKNRDPKNLLNILKGLGKRTKVFMEETINAVVMIDTQKNIDTAKKMVAEMDRARRQVMIDVKLVEIQKGALKELGPDFSNTELSFGDFKNLPTAQTNMILNTLIEENKATTLASPRIRVLDKEEAEINVGDRIPIEITTSSRTAGGDNIQLNRTVQWESVGIKLKITCQKIHNDNELTLQLYNEVSTVIRFTQAGYPQIRTRNAQTILRLRNGETVAFGGLINSLDSKTNHHIPLLARLPVLGRIFQNLRNEQNQTEIVMFVTPQLRSNLVDEVTETLPSDESVIRGASISDVPNQPEIKPYTSSVVEINNLSDKFLSPAAKITEPVKEIVEKPVKKNNRMAELLKRLKKEQKGI